MNPPLVNCNAMLDDPPPVRVTPNGAPRLARSRPTLHVLFGEHQLGLFGGRTRAKCPAT